MENTLTQYYGNEGNARCVDNFLRDIAKTVLRKNTSTKIKLLVVMARNIIYNSRTADAYEFVRTCESKDTR